MEEQQSKIMDEDLHSALINTLTAHTRGLEAVKVSQDQPKGRVVGGCMDAGGGGGAGDMVVMTEQDMREERAKEEADEEGDGEEKVWSWRKVLESMRELARYHLDTVTLWRETVRKWECRASFLPREGSRERLASRGGGTVLEVVRWTQTVTFKLVIDRNCIHSKTPFYTIKVTPNQ